MRKSIWGYSLLLGGLLLDACGDKDSVSSSDPVMPAENAVSSSSAVVFPIDSVESFGSCIEDRYGNFVCSLKGGGVSSSSAGESGLPVENASSAGLSSAFESAGSSESLSSSESVSSSETASFSETASSSETGTFSEALSSSALPLSSSELQVSSSVELISSSSSHVVVDLTLEYDCSEYSCVYTGYLNTKMLGSGKYGQYLDTRDGLVYRTVTIGSQTWMAQNLSYITANSRCYEDDPVYCYRYGRLYYQNEAMTACPEGWHLPSGEEWDELKEYVASEIGGYAEVGNGLKSFETWSVEIGTDAVGFSGVASRYFGKVHVCGGSHGVYWTSDECEYRCLLNDKAVLYSYWEAYSVDWGMSVRCILDD